MEAGLSPGRTVGHYVVAEKIGEGGMGVVYKGRDSHLGRLVALKVLAPDLTAGTQRDRLLREAQAVASLNHQGIATIYDIDSADGVEFIAMEFVAGRTLAELIPRGGLPVREALKLAVQIADALGAAHAAGIVHRDLKPGNVMVTPEGRVKVLDFGLAKFTARTPTSGDRTTALTSAGAVVGTAIYMSPEQARGQPVDQRSDVFSLGLVLHQMLTGQHPFHRTTAADTLSAVLHDPVPPLPPLPGLMADAEGELQRLVQRCLEKRPDDRCQSGAEVLAAIRGLRRRIESAEFPVTPVPQPAPPRWRGRVATATVAAVACVALGATWLARQGVPRLGLTGRADAEAPPVALPVARPRQVTSTPGAEREPAVSPDGNLVAYASSDAGNSDIWIAGVGGANLLRLTDDQAADTTPCWFPDGSALAFTSERGGTSAIWKVPVLGGAATLLVPDARAPAIDPTGTRVALVRNGPGGMGRVAVAHLSDAAHVTVLTHDDDGLWDHRDPAWSPDGRAIAYAAQRGLWTVPSTGGEAHRLTTDDEPDEEPVWSADGRYVYFSSQREGTEALWRVAAAGGHPERVTLGTGPETHPSLSRDGRRLAYTTLHDNVDLVLRELLTGKETVVPGGRTESFPSFSPDGRSVVFVSDRVGGERRIWQQPLKGGRPSGQPRMLTDHPSAYPAYSPDGRWIAYYRLGGGRPRHIWIVPSDGGMAVQFTNGSAHEVQPAWSPRGTEIAYASSEAGSSHIRVRPFRDGRPAGAARELTFGVVNHEAPAWSPDGRQLAFVGADPAGRTDIWLVPADGTQPARRVTSLGRARRVKWHPVHPVLLVSGLEGDWVTLWQATPVGASMGPFKPPVRFGRQVNLVDFDVTRDGRWLAFVRETAAGDVWVAEVR